MTLGQLRTFVEVARTGSVRGAAAALVVTEPSVSAAVAALQREMTVALVERVGRGIRLTDAGRELARYAAEILGLVDRTGRAVREAAGGPGHLRLAAVTTAGEYVLPPLIAGFRERRPDVQVSLEVGNRAMTIEHLLAFEADIAVGGRPPARGGIEGEALLPNALVVVAPPDHPLRGGRRLGSHQLSGETWLVREPGSGTRETAEEFFGSVGITPAARMTVSSNSAIKQAAAVGLGVTLISHDAVVDDLEAGRLVELAVRGTPVRRSWYVLYRSDAPMPRVAQEFLDFVRARSV